MKYRYRSIAALISALLEVYWVSVDEFLVGCVDIQEPVHSDSSAEWETSQVRLVEPSHMTNRYRSIAALIGTLLEVYWVGVNESVVRGIDTQ
jgi:uncharacterized membrane protein